MARRLTNDQLRIVQTLDRPLFVAAGAGSGKSSTLAERVAWALDPASGQDGVPFVQSLDQVLVITFTHAAADEIREKIRERLREGGMDQQALAVDSAWISTIHGMCSRILRRHAFDLGIDPRFAVLEASAQGRLVEQATDEVLREVNGSPEFAQLFKAFPARSTTGDDAAGTVFGMVRAVRDAAGSALRGFDSVRFPGVAPDADAALSTLMSESERALVLGRDQGAFGSATGMAEEERLQHDLAVLDEYLRLAPSRRAEALPEVLANISKPKNAYAKKTMKEVGADLKAAYNRACLMAAFAPMGQRAAEVMQLARMVDARYAQLKAQQGCLDNDDLLSRTFQAFRDHPDIAQHYGSKFRLVMVDEFQDTNAQQVRMIELLSGVDACHLTTVGDAQQSIYRFRAADVQVFRDREAQSDDASRVRLAMNFRSHADILSFVERTLSGEPLPDFMRLDPCPTRPDGLRARSLPRVDVEVLSSALRGGAPAPLRAQAMAAMIADRVAERIVAGERPQDVALLLGRMTNLDCYLQALRQRGIDCVVSGGSTFSRAPEVRVVSALVHVLGNPKDTQAGLFPVLVSELFSLEADDLCLLATKVQEANGAYARRGIDVGLLSMELPGGVAPSPRLQVAQEVLRRALDRLPSWRIQDVLTGVLTESGWVARCVAEGPDGQARLANALAAVRYVGQLVDEGGLGASRAAVEFDLWLSANKIGPASLSGGDTGAVQVMTVHASKGLEFPLVAIAECWGSSQTRSVVGVTCENSAGTVNATLVPKDVTLAMLADPPEQVSDSSDLVDWARFLTNANVQGDQQEQARLLYVAITRARESAILGISVAKSAKDELKPVLSAQVMATLFDGALPPLGQSTLAYGGTQPARVRHVVAQKSDDDTLVLQPEESQTLVAPPEEPADEQRFQLYEARSEDALVSQLAQATDERLRSDVFSYSSAHALMAAEAAKQGRMVAQEQEGSAAAPAQSLPEVPSVALVDEEDIDFPDAAQDADKATNLGSAFHQLAQSMIETGRDHSPERLEALSRQWHLSARQHARLQEAVGRWERSDLRAEALGHALVRPEVPFFIKVDSAYGTYVEGAIDLLCTDPGSSEALVVDYKTGDVGLTQQQVWDRHQMQANFYAHVMMSQGCKQVQCAFVCVECDRGDGQPVVVRYAFDQEHLPVI